MSNARRRASLKDDEELARMLQYQEQASASIPSTYHATKYHPSIMAGYSLMMDDEQESRDLQLARELARKDLEESSSRLMASKVHPSSSEVELSPSVFVDSLRRSSRQRSRSFDNFDPETLSEKRRGEKRSSLRSPTEVGSATMQEALAYVRQLQQQAFLDLGDHSATEAHDASAMECSDMELAWRMQELEISASNNNNNNGSSRFDFGFHKGDSSAGLLSDEIKTGSTSASASASSNSLKLSQEEEDLRLARYLEAMGTSMRQMSAAEISSILDSASGSQNTLQGSTNTLGDIDRQIALTRMHVTPPSSNNNSPKDTVKSSVITHLAKSDDATALRLTQSAKSMAEERNGLREKMQKSHATASGVPLSAPAHPTTHVNRTGLPTLDPIYSLDSVGSEVSNRPTRKKRGSFLRFGSRKPPSSGTLNAALAAIDIDDIAAPDDAIFPRPQASRHAANGNSSTQSTALASPRSARSWLPRSPIRGKKKFVAATTADAAVVTLSNTTSGPLPHSISVEQNIAGPLSQSTPSTTRSRDLVCFSCGQMRGSFIMAMERSFHPHCFRCATCRKQIDQATAFVVSRSERGEKRAHHPECFAEAAAVSCTVCNAQIPANEQGVISFVKHPFFDKEIMCPHHIERPGRRCTGCHRFEPHDAPFAELNDNGRVVCYSCCRSVVVDSADIDPLWIKVLHFFEYHLKLQVWDGMRNIPIVVVQSAAMNEALSQSNSPHLGHSQIMARGTCLANHNPKLSSRRLARAPSLRFETSSKSFRSLDSNEKDGFTFFEVPPDSKGNPESRIHAILCLSGLPRDLTASILAHEATHAWITLHPDYDFRRPLPPQVEEGCAQLIAMLLLSEGLGPPPLVEGAFDEGPTDERLRQYFMFCIEREESEVFGEGYRKAAAAYRDIGIETLLNHIVRYREIPST